MVAVGHARAKIGATAVPLNYRLTSEETAYIVEDSDAVLIYTDAEQAETFARIRPQMTRVRHVVVHGGHVPEGMLDGDALVARASTAEPPPAPGSPGVDALHIGHDRTARKAPSASRSIPPRSCRCSANRTSGGRRLSHDRAPLSLGPGRVLQIAQLLGNTAVIQRKFDPEDWLRLVQEYQVTTTFSAPDADPHGVQSAARGEGALRLLEHAADDRQCRALVVRPEGAVPRDFPEDSLWEVYGSTELGVDTVLAPNDQRRKPGSCGQAAPGVEIKLFDDQGSEVTDPNVPGEVFVRGASNFVELPQGDGEVRPRTARRMTSSRWATSRIATPRASTTSAIARAT